MTDWKEWEKTSIEKVHTQFLKRLIGVNRSTTNAMVRGELGRHSLLEKVTSRNLNYLNYIENKGENSLIKQATVYEKARTGGLGLYSIKMRCIELDQEVDFQTLGKKEVTEHVRNSFGNRWRGYLDGYPKADTYKTFKDTVRMEEYLTDLPHRKLRVALSKFRLSDHHLMIERGRHFVPKIPRERRFCPFCPGEVESEGHFLLACSLYRSNRGSLLEACKFLAPNFEFLSIEEKFVYAMSQGDLPTTYIIAQIIRDWMEYRMECLDLFSLVKV